MFITKDYNESILINPITLKFVEEKSNYQSEFLTFEEVLYKYAPSLRDEFKKYANSTNVRLEYYLTVLLLNMAQDILVINIFQS